MKKLILTIILATLVQAVPVMADPDFSPLLGKTFEYAIEQFGPASYLGTTNFVLHGRNQGTVDVYRFNLGYGFLEVWINENQMGRMPPRHVVLTQSFLRHTGNAWNDAFGGQ